MRLPDLMQLSHRLSHVFARWSKGTLILMYHRVADVETDPWDLGVTPEHFDQHLEVVRSEADPVSLRDYLSLREGGKLPRRPVVLTFDDGYLDNLVNATPLLHRHGVPATVFVTSGQIGRSSPFWWDDLARLLLEPETLPDVLEMNINDRVHTWQLGDAARYPKHIARQDASRNKWAADPAPRYRFYFDVWKRLQPITDDARTRVLAELEVWAGAPAADPQCRAMNHQELQTLADDNLIEVGAHTMTHPLLSAHDAAVQQSEIAGGKRQLEEMIGRRVESFSYPFGDVPPAAEASVIQAGFRCACAVQNDRATRYSNVFALPRVVVTDTSGVDFERKLDEWFRKR